MVKHFRGTIQHSPIQISWRKTIMVYSKMRALAAQTCIHYLGVFFLCSYGLLAASTAFCQSIPESKTRLWLNEIGNFSLGKIIENISLPDSTPGAVIAARSKYNPNYYYHWVRDAGLTIDSLINFFQSSTGDWKHELISKKIFEYLEFSTKLQKVKTFSD